MNYKKLSFLGTQESWEARQVAIRAEHMVWVRSLGPASCLKVPSVCLLPLLEGRLQASLPEPPHALIPAPLPACPAWELGPTRLPLLWKCFPSDNPLLTASYSWFLSHRSYYQTPASGTGEGGQEVQVKRSSQVDTDRKRDTVPLEGTLSVGAGGGGAFLGEAGS